MEDTKRGIIDSIIRYLIIFMTLLVSFIVMYSMIKKDSDYIVSMIVGITFIFILIFLKWVIKEIEM